MDVGSYDFLRQERVIFGKPAAQAVAEEAHRLAVGRLFVVCANSLSRKTDAIEAIGEALGHHYVGRFDKCVEHTPRESVIAAADAARHADPDLIVTIGGGTAIDTAKVMLICLAQGVRTPEEMDDLHVSIDADGAPHIPVIAPSPIRQIIVPTTLSGAEFSNLGGCTDSRRKVKDAYTAPDICGQSVILDPEITRHTPEWLWLSTGIRAIDHAVEAVCSSAAQPFTDALALHALRLFATALRRNHHSPDDLAARLDSQQAVWMAASSINRVPYGASHGIGHALGAMAGVSHGHTSCVLLPAVLRFNESVNGERQKLVAEALDRPNMEAADAVAELIADLELPGRMQDLQVDRGLFGDIARTAMNNLFVRQNPKPIRDAGEIVGILESAW